MLPSNYEYACDIPIAVDECGKAHISELKWSAMVGGVHLHAKQYVKMMLESS